MKKFIYFLIFSSIAFSPLYCNFQGGNLQGEVDTHVYVSNEGMTKFNDGSLWKIRNHHRTKVRYWRTSHQVVIELNTKSHKGKFPFRLHNLNKDEFAMARIIRGPDQGNALRIKAIDENGSQILLSNDHLCEVAESDWSVVMNWKFIDTIMIGEDTTGSGKRYFLININTMNYVFADIL